MRGVEAVAHTLETPRGKCAALTNIVNSLVNLAEAPGGLKVKVEMVRFQLHGQRAPSRRFVVFVGMSPKMEPSCAK